MCLVSKWRFSKKAKEDIVCYKILGKMGEGYYTPYQDVKVDVTKPLKAVGNSITFFDPLEKRSGYIHTISSLEYIKMYLHDFDGIEFAVFKCIIPKGTKYHKSKDGTEYCSRKIIFDKQIQSYEIHNIH